MHWKKIVISFSLSLFFLYLTFFIPQIGSLFHGTETLKDALFSHARFNLEDLKHIFRTTNWHPIILAGVIFFGSMFVRAWRWQWMLHPLVKMPFRQIFGAMSIGYMVNDVLPLRVGEVYRAQVIYQLSGLSRSAAFGSVVLERFLDLFFMIPYVVAAVLLVPFPAELRVAATIFTAIICMSFGVLVWVVFDERRAMNSLRVILRVLPARISEQVTDCCERFASGLRVLKKPGLLIALSLSSLILWAMYSVMVYLVLRSMGFYQSGISFFSDNPVGAVLVILVITTVGFAIPGAPGGVGTYHGTTVMGLSLFQVPGNQAAGFAILLHALNYIPLTLTGLIFFWTYGLSFRENKSLAVEVRGNE